MGGKDFLVILSTSSGDTPPASNAFFVKSVNCKIVLASCSAVSPISPLASALATKLAAPAACSAV